MKDSNIDSIEKDLFKIKENIYNDFTEKNRTIRSLEIRIEELERYRRVNINEMYEIKKEIVQISKKLNELSEENEKFDGDYCEYCERHSSRMC